MPAEVDKYFSPSFSWWVSLTCKKCKVTPIHVDFRTFDVGVVGSDVGKQRFRDEYNRIFNDQASILQYILGR